MNLVKALQLIEAAASHIEAARTLSHGGRFHKDEIAEAKRALTRAWSELDVIEELEREQAGDQFEADRFSQQRAR